MQTNSSVATFTIANILGSQLFGIPVDRIASGLLLTLLGLCGRLAVEAWLSYQVHGRVIWPKMYLLTGVGLLSATTITITVLGLLKASGVVDDSATLLSLLFFGALGADGLQWLMNLAAKTMRAKVGSTPKLDGIIMPPPPDGKP